MTIPESLPQIKSFTSSGGAQVFQIPMQLFQNLLGYAYLVLVNDGSNGDYRVLIDTGSGFGDSNQHLEAGLAAVSNQLGRLFSLADLTHIFITHGHIDHIGGLTYVRPRTQALLGVHELDLRNITNYEERITLVSHRLGEFLIEAGVSDERSASLIDMYTMVKRFFHSVPVDFTYENVGMHVGPFEFLHVPGHCAGHVVIRLHDILFSGDHVLEGISPHQSPEHLTLSTGLEHYLKSLQSLCAWAGEIKLTLGGHHKPILDLQARLDEIEKIHRERLDVVLNMLDEPNTIVEVSRQLFGEVHGYNVLLALEEAGAHVEYLYQHGLLGIENLKELEHSQRPIAIRYRCLPCLAK